MLLSDLRYVFRTLRKSPVFAAAAILTMALAIGATTAIFSVVDTVLIRPLPYRAPDRLMQVAEKNDRLNIPTFSSSVLNYLSWKEYNHSFEDLGAAGFASYALSGRGDPEQFLGGPITPSFLPVLGIAPVLGRGFREGEDRPGNDAVVMISEGLWKRRFGGDPAIIGSHIAVDGIDRSVVGIAPPALQLLSPGDIWVPLTLNLGQQLRLNHVITTFGRLHPGVTQQQAQAEMDVVARLVGSEYPEVKDWGIRLISLRDSIVPDSLRNALVVLFAAVGLVLLIGCANVANLLLSRATARQKEIAVRTALGASRGRLVGLLLIESLVLSISGGLTGVLGALASLRIMNRMLPAGVLPIEVEPNSTVLLFAVCVTVVTGLLFGLAPSWSAARTDLASVLKQAGRGAVGGHRLIVRHSLVAVELALATVLLIGAGLLAQSLLRLQRVQLGFRPDGVLSFQLAPPLSRYPAARRWLFYRDLIQKLNALPGVEGTGISSGIPFGAGAYTRSPLRPDGRSMLPAGGSLPIDWRAVSPGYFRVMGIPILAGREFTEHDDANAPTVVILSRETAHKFWGTEDPVGKTITRPADPNTHFTVVGVAGDVRHTSLNDAFPAVYYSAAYRQWPTMDFVVRTGGKPEALLPGVRQIIHDTDPELPLASVRTMEGWVSNSAAQPRLNAVLVAIFAGIALTIAAVGVYGVLAYAVNQRTREIGLRLALGAQRSGVLRWIVGQGMMVACAGILVGLAGAFALSRALGTLLFGIEPHDPWTFGVSAGALLLIALAACLVPARRASNVDPMVALRDD